MESAGLAIKALTTNSSVSAERWPMATRSIKDQKEEFKVATSQYFSLLSSIDVRLRRQINALEEADIIPAEAASKDAQNTSNLTSAFATLGGGASVKGTSGSKQTNSNGGLGNLDVAWLNSRNDKVGKEMDAELWEKAKAFVTSLEKRKDTETEDVDLLSENT